MSERKITRAVNGLSSQISNVIEAMQLAEPYLEPETIDLAADVISRAESRRQLSAEHVVVGLFGATGSGKSTMFNALVGEELAMTGSHPSHYHGEILLPLFGSRKVPMNC